MTITNHGGSRLIERTFCKRKDMEKFLFKIWEGGKKEWDLVERSPLRRYVENVRKNGGLDRSVRVKGNTVYIFNKVGSVFVTCYDIPQKVLQDNSRRSKI